MTNKQFIKSLVFFTWFLSTAALSTFAFAYGHYAPNPNYPLWILGIVFLNIACAVRWFHKYLINQKVNDES